MIADRHDWHAARRRCITASWVAAVLGIDSPAGTALDAWAYYCHDVRAEETDAMRTGRRLEPVILEWAADELSKPIVPWPQDHLAGGAPDIWGATPDGLTDEPAPVEAKAWSYGGAWADGPPLSILIQLQVQIDCLGATHGWVAALLAGRFDLWRVERHDTLIRRARAACRRWWDRHVLGGEMPGLDGRPQTGRLLARLYQPTRQDWAARLPSPASEIRAEVAQLRALAAATRERADLRANQLRALLGANQHGVCPGGEVVSHVGARLTLPNKLPRGVRPPSPWRE